MSARDAPTQYIQAGDGTKFGYRTVGPSSSNGSVPLICVNHFRGNMDWWDPLLVDTLATEREVILFDQPGIGKSSGTHPATFRGWAESVIAFIETVGFQKVDALGHSMGGRVSQLTAIIRPDLFRKVVLAAAPPATVIPDASEIRRDPKYYMALAMAKTREEMKDAYRTGLFGESDLNRKQFEQYWARLEARSIEPPLLDAMDEDNTKIQIGLTRDVDDPIFKQSGDALNELKMPILVATGKDDHIIGVNRAIEVHSRLPNAQLVIYPSSNHGFLCQYPEVFGKCVNDFLDTNAFDPIT